MMGAMGKYNGRMLILGLPVWRCWFHKKGDGRSRLDVLEGSEKGYKRVKQIGSEGCPRTTWVAEGKICFLEGGG
jgi:hypothetical protein